MGKSLLLADDSVTIQKVVGLSFASEDIQITTVDNGDDALARARELRPDVILADVVMPGMSGYEVCEAVKADAELRHIPVLLLTGTFEAFDDARAAQVGAAGHVAKPFEAQTLVERVKELLANAPAPEPPAAPTPEEPVAHRQPPTVVDTPTYAPEETLSVDAAAVTPPVVEAPPAPASFDFFDEPVASASETPEPEGAFSFGADDLDPSPSTEPPPAAAHTIAILPDDLDDADPMLPPVPSSFAGPAGPSAPPSESFDFEFESVRAQPAPEASDPIAEASPTDPVGKADYDVSASDLGDLQFSSPNVATQAPPAPPTELLDPDAAGTPASKATRARVAIPSLDADPVMQLLSSPELPEDAAQLVDATPEAADPFETPEPIAMAAFEMPEPTTPESPREPIATARTEIDAFAAEADAPAEAEPAWPAAPVADALLVADEAMAESLPDAEALVAEIAPVLREQLHETLEKIAWESFGQVTDTIVEHAVERLEKAAWEVVPKLAETLILEEIRKLKGE